MGTKSILLDQINIKIKLAVRQTQSNFCVCLRLYLLVQLFYKESEKSVIINFVPLEPVTFTTFLFLSCFSSWHFNSSHHTDYGSYGNKM